MSYEDPTIPPAWAAYLPEATGLLRQALAAAGAAGFTWALTVNADQAQMAVSAAMMLASAAWSFVQKVRAKRALRRAQAGSALAAPPKLPL